MYFIPSSKSTSTSPVYYTDIEKLQCRNVVQNINLAIVSPPPTLGPSINIPHLVPKFFTFPHILTSAHDTANCDHTLSSDLHHIHLIPCMSLTIVHLHHCPEVHPPVHPLGLYAIPRKKFLQREKERQGLTNSVKHVYSFGDYSLASRLCNEEVKPCPYCTLKISFTRVWNGFHEPTLHQVSFQQVPPETFRRVGFKWLRFI